MRMILAAVACCALPALPGAAQTPPPETVFTAVAPCRALLTPTKIPANTSRLVQIVGSGFGSQGGPTGGCGVPASATAVAMSFTAYGASSPGYLTAYAAGAARPGVTSVSYPVNGAATAGTIVQLGDQGRISLFAAKDVTVAGDVTGYYAPKLFAFVAKNGTLYRGNRVTAVIRPTYAKYSVFFDRNIDNCVAHVTSEYAPYFMSAQVTGDKVDVYTYDKTGTASEYYFYLSVNC
jgi:hypothetical protein